MRSVVARISVVVLLFVGVAVSQRAVVSSASTGTISPSPNRHVNASCGFEPGMDGAVHLTVITRIPESISQVFIYDGDSWKSLGVSIPANQRGSISAAALGSARVADLKFKLVGRGMLVVHNVILGRGRTLTLEAMSQ